MCQQNKDVRDFKRFINSVISIIYNGSNYLNKRDLMIIEYIRLYNLPLYQQIFQNRVYFISHDKITDSETYAMSFNIKHFNAKAKDYFKELFLEENHFSYIDILSEIFPYVKKYKNNQDLEYDGIYYSDGLYSDIVKNRRICSGKYFNLYFTNTVNEFLLIGNLAENFVVNLNQIEDFDSRIKIFDTFLKSVPPSYHKEMFERFQLYIEDLQENIAFDLVVILFKKINDIDNSPASFALDARKRVEVIICELLQQISDNQYNEYLTRIKHDYGKIETISSILYWFKDDREGKNIEGRVQLMQNIYEEMGNSIVNNCINIYDDSYYTQNNVWGLYKVYKDEPQKIKEYIKKVINEENIFRLLYDIIGVSYGHKIIYSIKRTNLETLTTEEDIDTILKNAKPISKDQQFTLDVYEKYKEGISDEWGEEGVVTNEFLNIKP